MQSRARQRRFHRWSSYLWTAVAIGGANLAFFALVDRIATTKRQLIVTLDASVVSAMLGDAPPAQWQSGPAPGTKIGLRIDRTEIADQGAGFARVSMQVIPPKEPPRREEIGRFGRSPWPLPADWQTNHRGHLVTQGRPILWLSDWACSDCVLEFELVNVRELSLFVRARDDRDAVLLRWRDEALSWHEIENGEVGPAHGIVRILERNSTEKSSAELASDLLSGYLEAFQFVLAYLKVALPGLLLAVFLGLVWRIRRLIAQRFERPFGSGAGTVLRRLGITVGVVATLALAVYVSTNIPAGRGTPSPSYFHVAVLSALCLLGLASWLVSQQISHLRAKTRDTGRCSGAVATTILVAVLCTAAAAYSAYVAAAYFEGIPHVQDSVSYLLGAKALASGELRIPLDPTLAPFFEDKAFIRYRDGYLYPISPGWYFAGYPALLAVGVLAGLPWLVNPVCSGMTLGLLFLLCRELYGGSVIGVLAVFLGAISPLARFQSASMMAHTATLLFTTASFLSLVYWIRRRTLLSALTLGASLGALLNIRPFDSALVIAYVAVVLLASVRRLGWRRSAEGIALAIVGAIPFLLLIVWQIDVLGAMRDLGASTGMPFKFSGDAIEASRNRLMALNSDLFGWPALLGIPRTLTVGLLLMPILILPKRRADWFVIGWALLAVVGYAGLPWHGNFYGPRYWYASLGGMLILVARLLQQLPRGITWVACQFWPPGRSSRWRWLPILLGAVPMFWLVAPLFSRTLTESYPGYYWNLYGKEFNGFSRAPLDLLAEHNVRRGLIFFDQLPLWQTLLVGFAANDPSLDGNLIFARHIEGRDQILMEARPKHVPYLITWGGDELELGRLELDPETRDLKYTPFPTITHEQAPVIGQSSAFSQLPIPPLQGGVKSDAEGNLYVLNALGHEVLVFDGAGILRRRLRASYSFGPGAIRWGHGLAADGAGNVYVTDLDPPGLVRLNADGTFGWRVQKSPDGTQKLAWPLDAATLPSGEIVVADPGAGRLHVIRPDGTFAGEYGDEGRLDLANPSGIAVGRAGHVYVADIGLGTVVELDSSGREVHRWALPIKQFEPYEVPYVAADDRGHAYVSDKRGWVVYHARPGAEELDTLSVPIPWPSGLTVRGQELLIALDRERKLLRLPLP